MSTWHVKILCRGDGSLYTALMSKRSPPTTGARYTRRTVALVYQDLSTRAEATGRESAIERRGREGKGTVIQGGLGT